MMDVVYLCDWIFFCMMAFSTGYLLFFVLFSFKRPKKSPLNELGRCRYLVLFPAYKEDRVIVNSVSAFLNQSYPSAYYDVVVLSDHMEEQTNRRLEEMPVELLMLDLEDSSKAKALNIAVDHFKEIPYDGVVILDADNLVERSFLEEINHVFSTSVIAMQAHRVAKNRNSDVAVLDAVSEEINNTIFRKGFARAGLSATLSGSGMVFDFEWFKSNISQLTSSGEDKELEALLLKDKKRILYLEDLLVFDEKTENSAGFYQQRRRWIAAQYGTLLVSLKDLPRAIISRNVDYCNKLLQWTMFPRILLIGFIVGMALIWSIFSFPVSIKWWVLFGVLTLALCLAIPRQMYNKQLFHAVRKIPLLFLLMLVNLFRMKGAYRSFIHTEHKESHD